MTTERDTKTRDKTPHIRVVDLTMAYGDKIIQKDLDFTIYRGDIFIIMGGSGCGKSTLLKHLIGLITPAKGKIIFDNMDFWAASPEQRTEILQKSGILYQSGALWSSMTLLENVSLPLAEFTNLPEKTIKALASMKLRLVGLGGFEDYYPAQLSGGMKKRAALARAIALDPEVLFFDEPSAGLDPVSSKRLDDLILELRDSLGATVVIVTHELASIFSIGNNSIFLDSETKTMLATGDPKKLLMETDNPKILEFLTRGTMKREVALV
ncbi:MAG: ATP-binding cassette domain-containing protein [Thermodesulfobacteria bacterium]|nr:ATP-binding cassette domain-containing protein [Thermodesulfobacteriota bacterium]